MCGIIGYVGKNNNCVRVLIDGLEKLEYRGYDSAGIAFVKDDNVEIIKKENVLFSSSRQLKRIGAKNETIAKQRAYSVIANNVAEILRKEFMAYEKAKE